jgi:hypothetical protein
MLTVSVIEPEKLSAAQLCGRLDPLIPSEIRDDPPQPPGERPQAPLERLRTFVRNPARHETAPGVGSGATATSTKPLSCASQRPEIPHCAWETRSLRSLAEPFICNPTCRTLRKLDISSHRATILVEPTQTLRLSDGWSRGCRLRMVQGFSGEKETTCRNISADRRLFSGRCVTGAFEGASRTARRP